MKKRIFNHRSLTYGELWQELTWEEMAFCGMLNPQAMAILYPRVTQEDFDYLDLMMRDVRRISKETDAARRLLFGNSEKKEAERSYQDIKSEFKQAAAS